MRRSPAPELSDSITRNRIENTSVAGFPIPHTDSANTMVDLNAQLLVNPCSSFLFRMKGDSMEGIGIHEGDTDCRRPLDRSTALTISCWGWPIRSIW